MAAPTAPQSAKIVKKIKELRTIFTHTFETNLLIHYDPTYQIVQGHLLKFWELREEKKEVFLSAMTKLAIRTDGKAAQNLDVTRFEEIDSSRLIGPKWVDLWINASCKMTDMAYSIHLELKKLQSVLVGDFPNTEWATKLDEILQGYQEIILTEYFSGVVALNHINKLYFDAEKVETINLD